MKSHDIVVAVDDVVVIVVIVVVVAVVTVVAVVAVVVVVVVVVSVIFCFMSTNSSTSMQYKILVRAVSWLDARPKKSHREKREGLKVRSE